MIQVLRKRNLEKDKEQLKLWKSNDDTITVVRTSWETEISQDSIIKKKKTKEINLTRKINETAKVIKQDNAMQKLEQIKKALSLEEQK